MKVNKSTKLILKILVASGLIAWFLHKTDLHQLFRIFTSLPTKVFVVTVLLMFFLLYLNSVKWFLLLPKYRILKLFELNLIGQYYSLILPGQLMGEGAKAILLGKNKDDKESVWMSVMLDKVTGIIALFILGLTGLIFTNQKLPAWLALNLLFMIFACFLFLFLMRIKIMHDLLRSFLNKLNARFNRLKKITEFLNKFIDVWWIYNQNTKIIFQSIAIGIACQTLSIIINMLLANAFLINLSFIDWCWIQAVLSIVILLPVSVGGIGLREGSLIGMLGLFNFSSEKALALSLAIFNLQIIRACAGGILDYRLSMTKNLS